MDWLGFRLVLVISQCHPFPAGHLWDFHPRTVRLRSQASHLLNRPCLISSAPLLNLLIRQGEKGLSRASLHSQQGRLFWACPLCMHFLIALIGSGWCSTGRNHAGQHGHISWMVKIPGRKQRSCRKGFFDPAKQCLNHNGDEWNWVLLFYFDRNQGLGLIPPRTCQDPMFGLLNPDDYEKGLRAQHWRRSGQKPYLLTISLSTSSPCTASAWKNVMNEMVINGEPL